MSRQPSDEKDAIPITGVLGDDTAQDRAKPIWASPARPIVESSDDAIISKTLDGTITSWNKAAERIFGYAAAEIIGQPITVLMPPEHADDVRQMLGRIRRGERIGPPSRPVGSKDRRIIDDVAHLSPQSAIGMASIIGCLESRRGTSPNASRRRW